jgi:L-ascorbate metabolism protein UlaG (beta-lactamase superfamily)
MANLWSSQEPRGIVTGRLWTAIVAIWVVAICVHAQSPAAPKAKKKTYQARPPATRPFGKEAFTASRDTTLRWTGNAGFLINSRGTTVMIDPLLQGFDMPMLIDLPIEPNHVPRLDAVLVTHADNDHYSVPTLRDLAPVTREIHSTVYAASLMKKQGWPARGHDIGDVFDVGVLRIRLTPVDHAWQNAQPNPPRHFANEDACGFWIETPDGSIWAPGDSRLMPEHLRMPAPDAILFDFSDNEWHFGLQGAAKLANAYPQAVLLLSHWGTVDAPDFTPFNGDPKQLEGLVANPARIKVLAPGEPFVLRRLVTK